MSPWIPAVISIPSGLTGGIVEVEYMDVRQEGSAGKMIRLETGDICIVGGVSFKLLAIWVGKKSANGWLNLIPPGSDRAGSGEYTSGWGVYEVVGNIRKMGPALEKALGLHETKK